ncbi:MAG: M20/M25/M40 family metallo-hydrolase [Sandaracinaceae bacterium]|nr:M20/M25/M40 family metallo-hydrolase [Sandaracinaceae bacterium]
MRTVLRRERVRFIVYPSLVLPVVALSVCSIAMPGASFRGELPSLSSRQAALVAPTRGDVEALASGIGLRNIKHPEALLAAEHYVRGRFESMGFAVRALPYSVNHHVVRNLEVTVRGTTHREEIVVVGAHYDSEPTTPGADDNATGVAAMLALAAHFKDARPERTLRFVAFVNEEPPYFWNDSMGSLVYARACKAANENIVAMLSLESLGYYKTAHGTQQYPWPMSLFYPDTADFVAFVGNLSSRSLTRAALRTFRDHARFPSEGASPPSFIPGVGWSDHWSFWQVGYPALMVTDTAPFRNSHYHDESDTAATLDFERLARVTDGLTWVIADLVRVPSSVR